MSTKEERERRERNNVHANDSRLRGYKLVDQFLMCIGEFQIHYRDKLSAHLDEISYDRPTDDDLKKIVELNKKIDELESDHRKLKRRGRKAIIYARVLKREKPWLLYPPPRLVNSSNSAIKAIIAKDFEDVVISQIRSIFGHADAYERKLASESKT